MDAGADALAMYLFKDLQIAKVFSQAASYAAVVFCCVVMKSVHMFSLAHLVCISHWLLNRSVIERNRFVSTTTHQSEIVQNKLPKNTRSTSSNEKYLKASGPTNIRAICLETCITPWNITKM